jgi:peptidoglycan/LPS O-acetylase OafA/YrhL
LVVFYYPFYLLCLVFFVRNYKKVNLSTIYILLVIALFWITTVLTCDDWHNRFFLTITPYIFILGLSAFTEKKINI